MENGKIFELLEMLGEELSDLINNGSFSIDEDRSIIEVNGAEYMVLTDEEADESFYNYEMELLEDLGIEGLSDSFKSWVYNNAIDSDYFEECIRETYEDYADDIEYEESYSDFENRLQEEMNDWGANDKEEFIDKLTESAIDEYGGAIHYCIDNYGEEWFNRVLRNNSYLIDYDSIIEEIERWDGRGIIATYDFEEKETDNYYVYRIN